MTEPVAKNLSIIVISLNEEHNMEAFLRSIFGWCNNIYLVDSCSSDRTVDIALKYGVNVVQHRFRDFGDQWNFAITHFDFPTDWIMKLDPDERLSTELKASICRSIAISETDVRGFRLIRRLNFMGQPLPIHQPIERVWRKNSASFSKVRVNEHLEIEGKVDDIEGYLEHLDSPNLHHWYAKQNNYFTAEALMRFHGEALASEGRLLGTQKDRRLLLKRIFWKLPCRYVLLHLYHLLGTGAWRAGKVGRIWAKIRTEAYRSHEFKFYEMQLQERPLPPLPSSIGERDPRVPFID